MKLLELDLLAFGPFADVRLDFSRGGALHLVYGPNEAGKTTALRAITSLLYGIPVNTADAHRHAMRDLRIGARIAAGNGSVLHVVRRKGAKNTLLDSEGTSLGDDVLGALLGGVGESLFRSAFGLDHMSLRQGAEALLQGRGGIGESLFAAAIGGRGTHELLERLESEASALYKPRGQTPRLNEAIRAFKEADARSKNAAKSAEAYRVQQDGLEHARAEGAALAERRRRLGAEQSQLRRAQRVLPVLGRHQSVRARRDALGELPRLAEDAARRRAAASGEAGECMRARARLLGEIEALAQRLAGLREPQSLLAIGESVIQDIQNRLGNHRHAAKDLPRRRSELRLREDEALAIPARLGRHVPLDGIESLRVPAPLQARTRKLAQQRSGLEAALDHATRELADRLGRLERQRSQLSSLAPVPELRGLQHALSRAQRLGDVDEEIASSSARVEKLEQQTGRKLAALGLWQRDGAALRLVVLPTAEAVERYAARFDELERATGELTRRRHESERRTAQLARELEELRLAGDLPSEEQLLALRRRRDGIWEEIRRVSMQGGAPAEPVVGEYELAVRDADQISDRLRREANRVATRAKLTAEMTERSQERDGLEREQRDLTTRREQLQAEWSAAWSPAGFDPPGPVEMRGWLIRAAAVVQLADQLDEERAKLVRLRSRRAQHQDEIERELGALGEPVPPGEARFDVICAWAERALARWAERDVGRRKLDLAITEGEADIPDLERRYQDCRERMESWSREWEASAIPLGLQKTALPEEALAVLDQLGELFAKIGDVQQLQQRIDAMERDALQLDHDVGALAARHATALGDLPVEERADGLIRLYREAQIDHRDRQHLQAELVTKREELHAYEERAARAAAELAELMRAARVQSMEELEAVEDRVASAVDLDQELRALENELLDAGDGATIDDLIEQTRSQNADAIRARLAAIEAELEDVQERQDGLIHQIGSLEGGLKQWEAGEGAAADAATEAQEHLAAIKSHVRKYVRLRLAAIVLRGEIERYREQNQGPLLARADALFPRLTLGRYVALRVGFGAGDEPVLRCLRADGTEVDVEGLSDGTRDDLYLALRVASLERHVELCQPMPVVLDDVLIHLDDARAAAALAVLAELATRTQVLFFTHEQRLVELARALLPETAHVEHELRVQA